MSTKALVRSFYGIFRVLYLIAGVSVLLLRTDFLPAAVRDLIVEAAQDNLNTLHIIQEFGSLLVFAGMITLWFTLHYDQSRVFHWAMTTFWGLLALVHWFDVRGPYPSVIGPLINTVPFGLFVVIGLLRLKSDGRAQTG